MAAYGKIKCGIYLVSLGHPGALSWLLFCSLYCRWNYVAIMLCICDRQDGLIPEQRRDNDWLSSQLWNNFSKYTFLYYKNYSKL